MFLLKCKKIHLMVYISVIQISNDYSCKSCFFLIVIGILFGAYRFVAGSLNHNNEDTKHHTPKRKVASPKIDVLSQDFHDNYMNRNHVKGYKGFEIGASKNQL